jgi:hypothetical protein
MDFTGKDQPVERASRANYWSVVLRVKAASYYWTAPGLLAWHLMEFPPHVKIQPRLTTLWEQGNSSHRPQNQPGKVLTLGVVKLQCRDIY